MHGNFSLSSSLIDICVCVVCHFYVHFSFHFCANQSPHHGVCTTAQFRQTQTGGKRPNSSIQIHYIGSVQNKKNMIFLCETLKQTKHSSVFPWTSQINHSSRRFWRWPYYHHYHFGRYASFVSGESIPWLSPVPTFQSEKQFLIEHVHDLRTSFDFFCASLASASFLRASRISSNCRAFIIFDSIRPSCSAFTIARIVIMPSCKYRRK